MNLLDVQYTKTPFYGVLNMTTYLRGLRYSVGKDRVRILLKVNISSWARDANLDQHLSRVREWMQNHYLLLDRKELNGIFIDLYGKKTD